MRIETKNLILRRFTLEDALNISNMSKQQSVSIEMSDMIMNDELAAIDWINMINSKKMINKLTVLAIESRQSRICIGYVYLHSKAELDGEVELGYAIHDDLQNKGYATEASKEIVNWAFKNMHYKYLIAITKPVNVASQKVVEKLNFKKIEERIVMYDGKEQLFYYYRLNAKEWRN